MKLMWRQQETRHAPAPASQPAVGQAGVQRHFCGIDWGSITLFFWGWWDSLPPWVISSLHVYVYLSVTMCFVWQRSVQPQIQQTESVLPTDKPFNTLCSHGGCSSSPSLCLTQEPLCSLKGEWAKRDSCFGEKWVHIPILHPVSPWWFLLWASWLSPTAPVLVPAHSPFHIVHFWVYSPTLEWKPKATGDSKKRLLTGLAITLGMFPWP